MTINGLELAARASRGAPGGRSRGSGARSASTPRGGITKRATQVSRRLGMGRGGGSTIAALSEPEGQSYRDLAGDGPGEGSVVAIDALRARVGRAQLPAIGLL